MNNYGLARLRISQVMHELAKREPLPRLENVYRLASKAIYSEFESLGTTEVIEDSMGFFLHECKHPANRAIFESGIENLTSANVVQHYINDLSFFSKKGNVLQSLCLIKEALIHENLFGEPCNTDRIENYFRDIDCYVPAVMNDLFRILQIPFTEHSDITTARSNTEVLFLK
jgi:hypothetical protein